MLYKAYGIISDIYKHYVLTYYKTGINNYGAKLGFTDSIAVSCL